MDFTKAYGISPWSVAREIGEISSGVIRPAFRPGAQAERVFTKEGGSLVTEADVLAERALSRRLTDLLAGSEVFGEEESGSADEAAFPPVPEVPTWIVDPIDGTREFASGNEGFGTLVALWHRNRAVAGWMHDPLSGRTWNAADGALKLRSANGEVVGAPFDRSAPVFAGAVEMREGLSISAYADVFMELDRSGFAVRGHRSTYKSVVDLIEGRSDFCVLTRQAFWDVAAPMACVRELGGVFRRVGGDFKPSLQDGPYVAARDARVADIVVEAIGERLG